MRSQLLGPWEGWHVNTSHSGSTSASFGLKLAAWEGPGGASGALGGSSEVDLSPFCAHICGRPPLRILWVMQRSAGCFKWRAEFSTEAVPLQKGSWMKTCIDSDPFDIRHCVNIVHHLSEHPSVCFTENFELLGYNLPKKLGVPGQMPSMPS